MRFFSVRPFLSTALALSLPLLVGACGRGGSTAAQAIVPSVTATGLAAQAVSGSLTLEPASAAQTVRDAAASGGQAAALLSGGHSARYVLPGTLTGGSYTVTLRARGDQYLGAPVVALRSGPTELGSAPVPNTGYAAVTLGTFSLTPSQALDVVFTNDVYGGGWPRDRNVVVDTLTLTPAGAPGADAPATPVAGGGGPGRLAVSGDGRRLEYADGRPFLYWADTGWELFHRLNRDEVRTYLRTRKDQGFTVIQAVALAEKDGLTTPNAHGDLPLAGKDPSRPLTTPGNNPASPGEYDYWDHMDYVVDEAASLGLTVALLPSWGRWVNNEPIFSPATARSFGTWLAQRYGDKPVIWVLGGDRVPETSAQAEVWRAMAAGIEQGAGGRDRALMTYHPHGGKTSAEYFHDEPWLDFNMWQTGHCRNEREAARVLATYNRTPVKPVINAEPVYEEHAICHNAANGYADATDVRNVAYWSVFAGADGHAYGHREIWGFDAHSGQKQWQTALGAPGAAHLRHLQGLLESRPAAGRAPDETLVQGGFTGARPVVALRGPDYAWVYSPDGQAFTVNLGRVAGGSLDATWFDPRTGARRAAGTLANSGTRSFTPPGSGRGQDWVLVLD
ncbi:DUF4038 domain-containing protein [Deinococcus aestuarii]|uniref:apiosidase-like domain-containing protein n=1 Tax=Deinococcus aestuarii TaxID=2774531 RepID=UPI001C0C48C5|nr:DUF4038 domain-containing protein [Deinococcus aestuarii]